MPVMLVEAITSIAAVLPSLNIFISPHHINAASDQHTLTPASTCLLDAQADRRTAALTSMSSTLFIHEASLADSSAGDDGELRI
jgi:hypothetical protein